MSGSVSSCSRPHGVARADRVDAPQFEGVDPEALGELVHRRFNPEDHLPQAVAAERTGGDVVRVDGFGVDPLGRRAIEADRLCTPVEQHAARVIAVRARVAEHLHPHGREHPGVVRAELDFHAHRMPHGGPLELVGAAHLVGDRPARAQHGEGDEVFGVHLLLAAEAAADPGREHPDAIARHFEHAAQRVAGEERDLAAGADHEPPVLVQPSDRPVGLELRVARAGGAPLAAHGGRAGGEGGVDVAVPAVDGEDHVAGGILHPVAGGAIGMDHRCAGTAGELRVEDRGQDVVLDADEPARRLGRRRGLGDDGRDALADVAHHILQHAGVVGIVLMVLVPRSRVAHGRHIAEREDGDDPVEPFRLGRVDRGDPGVSVGAGQHTQRQGGGSGGVERVGLETLHHPPRRRRPHAPADAARRRVRRGAYGSPVGGCAAAGGRAVGGAGAAHSALDRLADGPVPGAPAQVALHPPV